MGRRRQRGSNWSAEEAATVVVRWRRSGLSAGAFAEREGISTSRLWYWSKRLSKPNTVSFVPVTMRDANGDPGPQRRQDVIELEVGGVTVRVREGLDDERIARLCAALSGMARSC